VFLREQKFLSEIENLSLSALCKRGWPAWQSTIDNPRTLKQLVRHMRNAIAHGRIRFSSDSKILAEVQFEFADRDPNTGQLTWQATIGGDALRTFVLRLAKELDQRIG
jgi:HEPN pEK499 p136